MMCNHAAPRDAQAKFESVLMHVFLRRNIRNLVSTLTGSVSVSIDGTSSFISQLTAVNRLKTDKNILVAFDLEIFDADFHSDDVLICQGRMKAATPDHAVLSNEIILVANHQKNINNENVPAPLVRSL